MKKPGISSLLAAIILFIAWCPFVFSQDNDEKKSFEQRSEKELKSMDKKIDDLKARVARAKIDAKKDYDEMVRDLQKKREDAGRKWQELREAGSEKWDEAKAEFNTALKDLKNTYDRAMSHMKEKK